MQNIPSCTTLFFCLPELHARGGSSIHRHLDLKGGSRGRLLCLSCEQGFFLIEILSLSQFGRLVLAR